MLDTGMPRVLRPGYRLVTSLVIALLMFMVSTSWLPNTGARIVIAWDTGVAILLTLLAVMMRRTEPHQTLQRARNEETSSVLILLVTILTVAGALVDIGYGLPESKTMSRNLRLFAISQSIIGVFLAWLLLHIMYSLHYAKLYYGEVDDNDANAFRKGFVFPGNKDVVDYWDFVYYSFTIAMCFQTSDVTITSPYMRRLTIFHATVAYLFNLAILGLLLDGFISNIT
jgi:uncharacterized membrane protein